jgi:hypothetical protein
LFPIRRHRSSREDFGNYAFNKIELKRRQNFAGSFAFSQHLGCSFLIAGNASGALSPRHLGVRKSFTQIAPAEPPDLIVLVLC